MENYLPDEFRGEFVKLISANTLNSNSIDIFANIAAKKAFGFKLNRTINIICDVTNVKQSECCDCKKYFDKTKKELIKVFKIRNQLIHDDKEIELDKFIGYLYLNIASNFVKTLDSFCEKLSFTKVQKYKQEVMQEFEDLLKDIESFNNTINEENSK